ncbi:MAG TPA: prephenate dehydrogenase [Dehalococcoidales bacterium]|nr:prephenate dehydrogenase [Dehalococcoidales bacterium]
MRVAIIGGSGEMGRWFANFLSKDGKEVVISGRNESKLLAAKRQLGVEVASSVEAVKSADAVLLSVPIESFEKVVKEISPYIQPEQVVVDITSIKVQPVSAMHKYLETGLVLGAHPLFGPGAKGVANQNFVLTPTNDKESALAQKIREYLETRGGRVSLMTPEEHDEKMTVILGLSHFIAIVSADTLLSSDKLAQPGEISGITYKVLLTLVESVISENPELYASLQMNLPNVTEIEELFQRKAKEWADLVKNKDRQKFIQQMSALRNKLEIGNPDFGKAYENMYKLAAGL